MFFMNDVFAEEMTAVAGAQAPTFQSFTASLVPLLIFVAIFYFLLIRPQQKKQREHEKDVAALKPNDKVITSGGVLATVRKVKEKTLVVEIADGVEVEVVSDTVVPYRNVENQMATVKVEDKKTVKTTKTVAAKKTSKTEKVEKTKKEEKPAKTVKATKTTKTTKTKEKATK